jgi:serine/threonine protein kinase
MLAIVAALSIAVYKGFVVWKEKNFTESTLKEELRRMDSAWRIQRHEVTVGRRLGSGAFGDVFEALYRGINVAVKVLREWEDSRSNQEFEREILFMQTVRHPNIVLFLGSGSSAGNKEPFLVLEYMSRGSLRDVLYNVDEIDLSLNRKLNFAMDAARGMQFLHGLHPPRIHRDLKSANLLVSDDWMVKVSDFGLGRTIACEGERKRNTLKRKRTIIRRPSRSVRGRGRSILKRRNISLLNPDSQLSLSNIGTARWCAPELLSGEEYDTSVDVFRYTCIHTYIHTYMRVLTVNHHFEG